MDLSHSMYIFSRVKRSGKICSYKVYKNNSIIEAPIYAGYIAIKSKLLKFNLKP